MRLALRGFLRSWLCTESFANSPAYFSGSFRSLKYQGVRGTHLGAKMNSRKRSYTTYFLQHPAMVLGIWSRHDRLYAGKGYTLRATGDLAPQLATALQRLPQR